MLDVSQISDEQVEGLGEAIANFGITVQAGDYTVALSNLDDAKFFSGVTKKGFPWASLKGYAVRIVSGSTGEDTKFEGKTLSNQPFTSTFSLLAGVFTVDERKELGLTSPRAISEAINQLYEDQTTFGVRVDWNAIDFGKRAEVLLKLTETTEIDLAYQLATKEQNAEADAAAEVATTASDFPVDPKTGDRVPELNGTRAFPFVRTIYPATA